MDIVKRGHSSNEAVSSTIEKGWSQKKIDQMPNVTGELYLIMAVFLKVKCWIFTTLNEDEKSSEGIRAYPSRAREKICFAQFPLLFSFGQICNYLKMGCHKSRGNSKATVTRQRGNFKLRMGILHIH